MSETSDRDRACQSPTRCPSRRRNHLNLTWLIASATSRSCMQRQRSDTDHRDQHEVSWHSELRLRPVSVECRYNEVTRTYIMQLMLVKWFNVQNLYNFYINSEAVCIWRLWRPPLEISGRMRFSANLQWLWACILFRKYEYFAVFCILYLNKWWELSGEGGLGVKPPSYIITPPPS